MALLKIEKRWVNPAHVMVLKDQGGATEVYLVDPNHKGLQKADFVIDMPVDQVGQLLNDGVKRSAIAGMALVRVVQTSGRALWVNSAHVSRLEAGQYLPNTTAIYLVDPTRPGVVATEDLVVQIPLDEAGALFNDAVKGM
jgi:hypothetical protein